MRCAQTGHTIGYGRERHIQGCPACRYARRQWYAAMNMDADGQCQWCGMWRTDGRPPLEHPQWCDSPYIERWGKDVTVRHMVVVTQREIDRSDRHDTKQRTSPYVALLGESFTDPE